MAIKCDNKNLETTACGTIAWLRTTNGDVRQCKCYSTVWQPDGRVCREWLVAGMGMKTTTCPNLYDMTEGVLYHTEEGAQYELYDDRLQSNYQYPVCEIIVNKYKCSNECFCFEEYCRKLYLKGYVVTDRHTVDLNYLDVVIKLTNDGLEVAVPDFDNGTAFVTEKAARESMTPLPVYRLDDDDLTPVEQKPKTRVTVEVDDEQLENLRKNFNVIE